MAAITGYEVRERGKVDIYFADDNIQTWNLNELRAYVNAAQEGAERWSVLAAVVTDMGEKPQGGKRSFVKQSNITRESVIK